MVKALFLIVAPRVAWDGIVQARRGFIFILCLYLLPMVIMTAAVEGWGLNRWGKWQPGFQKIREFSISNIITFEIIQSALALALVLLGAFILLKISRTFQNRHNYPDAFTTIVYGYSPLFLAHLFDAGPMVSPWATWAIGIVLTIWILYQGIPRVMQPDPSHAFGLYLCAMFVVVLTSGLVRLMTALYLLGEVDFKQSALAHKFPSLFQ
jgi:hypothetical protein